MKGMEDQSDEPLCLVLQFPPASQIHVSSGLGYCKLPRGVNVSVCNGVL